MKEEVKRLLLIPLVIWVGVRVQNEVLDEIQPIRLNSKWLFPYVGRSYIKKGEKEE